MFEISSSFYTWCWYFGKFLNLIGQPDIIIFLISEASVNPECISWKIGFCVAPTKDRALITLCLVSTTGRGPCSYLLLKRISTTSTNQRDETQYKPSRETKYLFVSREHGRKANSIGNDTTHVVIHLGQKTLRLTCGVIWTFTQKSKSYHSRYSHGIFCIFPYYMSALNHVV